MAQRQFDSQVVELLGRNRLVNELLRAGLEVATPARDRGVDLIAYVDLKGKADSFVAKPVQMKSAMLESFSVERKYERISDLILAHVWHLESAEKAVTYGLLYPQAVQVAEQMGWDRTQAWEVNGYYSTTRPSERLKNLLEPYRMTPDRWWELVAGTAQDR